MGLDCGSLSGRCNVSAAGGPGGKSFSKIKALQGGVWGGEDWATCLETVFRSQVSKMPNIFVPYAGQQCSAWLDRTCTETTVCFIHPAPAVALPFPSVKASSSRALLNLAELKEKVCIDCGSVVGLVTITDLSWPLSHPSLLYLPPVCDSVCAIPPSIHPSTRSVVRKGCHSWWLTKGRAFVLLSISLISKSSFSHLHAERTVSLRISLRW